MRPTAVTVPLLVAVAVQVRGRPAAHMFEQVRWQLRKDRRGVQAADSVGRVVRVAVA